MLVHTQVDFYPGQAERAWRLSVPTVDPVVNAIGAGDVCTGVFAHHLGRGDAPEEAFAWGLAAACARVTRQLPGFEAEAVRQLRELVVVEPLEY